MTRTSPSSGLLNTYYYLGIQARLVSIPKNNNLFLETSTLQKDSAFPGLGNPFRRRSQCLCESGSMASGLCFVSLVYLGVGGWSQRPKMFQQVSGMPISWSPFRCVVFPGWLESNWLNLVVFCTDFQGFFLGGWKKSRWKTLPGGARGGTLDFQREMIQIIAKSSWYLRYYYYFFLGRLMKCCHVQCRSLKTHVKVDICLSLIQRVTFHEKSRGLVEFTLYGKPFFQHEEHVFVGWMCGYETGDLKGFGILRLFVYSKKILLLQSSKDLAPFFFCEAMKMVPRKDLLPAFSDIFSISLLYDLKQLTWFI